MSYLLVLWLLAADDKDGSLALNDAAALAVLLDRTPNLHSPLGSNRLNRTRGRVAEAAAVGSVRVRVGVRVGMDRGPGREG